MNAPRTLVRTAATVTAASLLLLAPAVASPASADSCGKHCSAQRTTRVVNGVNTEAGVIAKLDRL